MKLRELINRLEELSHNGRNDNMTVELHNEELGMNFKVKNAYIDMFNNCETFDESDDSYEYISLIVR